MIKLFLIFILLISQTSFAKPKYGPEATLLSDSNEYFRENKAPDFWVLMPYYTTQFNEKACSVASVSMLLNAARKGQILTSDDKNINQEDLLKKVADKSWSDAVDMKKPNGGVALEELKLKVEESLKAYKIKFLSVEAIHVDGSEKTKKRLHKDLVENEKSTKDFILANFTQGAYTGDSDVGHISPVGAYDEKRKKVLVLDIDHSWYEPYWVSEDTFLKGMNTKDSSGNNLRGYLYITLQK